MDIYIMDKNGASIEACTQVSRRRVTQLSRQPWSAKIIKESSCCCHLIRIVSMTHGSFLANNESKVEIT